MTSDYPKFYAVNDHPLKVIKLADGRRDLLLYDFATGGFVSNRDYFDYITPGSGKDVDQLTSEQFDEIIRPLRTSAVGKRVASPIIWELAKNPSCPYSKMLVGKAFAVRVNDDPAKPPFTLLVGGEELADLESWPEPWVRPDAPGVTSRRTRARGRDVRFYAVNDRPAKVIEFPDGTTEVVVYHFASGGFVADPSYEPHVSGQTPHKDVDSLTKDQFSAVLRSVRGQTAMKHARLALDWEPTGDAEVPYKTTIDGHLLTMRLNDFPAEPLYTLMVDGEELGDFDDWPSTWKQLE